MLDTVTKSISSRFEKHQQLCTDFSCFNPNNFQPNIPLPTNYLVKLYKKIRSFMLDILLMSYDDLKNEYTDFILKWEEFKKTIFCVYYELNLKIKLLIKATMKKMVLYISH